MKSEDRSVAEQPRPPPNLSGRRSVLSRTYRLPREEHRCATAAQRRENTAGRRYADAEDDFPRPQPTEGAAAAVRVPSFPAGNRRRRKIENYVFFSVSYRYICRHPKQNLAMALYRLESDRTQIGIDLDTKTRDNDLRHPDYARHAQIMRLVYVQSLLSGQSILQTIPSFARPLSAARPFQSGASGVCLLHLGCGIRFAPSPAHAYRSHRLRLFLYGESVLRILQGLYRYVLGTAMRSANPRNV